MTYDAAIGSASDRRHSSTSYSSGYRRMAQGDAAQLRRTRASPAPLIVSYVLDWAVLIAMAVVATVLGNITPNKRPFSLTDPNISFPFTIHETVPAWLLLVCSTAIPIVVIFLVCLTLIPGMTTPKGTPKRLVWRRKLWELHVGWLGLAMSLSLAWFITNGMKNLAGKPRPDLLSRCDPDLANVQLYILGGLATSAQSGQLVSGDICKSTDKSTLDDGFRSFPSGHSSSSAAGLVYLSLFLAAKFAVAVPFLTPTDLPIDVSAFSAFPARSQSKPGAYEPMRSNIDGSDKRVRSQHKSVIAAHLRGAAPPLYLLALTLLPTFLAVFIALSRWFNFRHHGFDILSGLFIGIICAFFSFRFYHLPIGRGAGWGWGPRNRNKAFWAGIGSYSYAAKMDYPPMEGDEESALHDANDNRAQPAAAAGESSAVESQSKNM